MPIFSIKSALESKLNEAVFRNQINETNQALAAGCDINTPIGQNGMTGLMVSVYLGYNEMVKLFLDKGADPEIQDEDGRTVLSIAHDEKALDAKTLNLLEKYVQSYIFAKEYKEALSKNLTPPEDVDPEQKKRHEAAVNAALEAGVQVYKHWQLKIASLRSERSQIIELGKYVCYETDCQFLNSHLQ